MTELLTIGWFIWCAASTIWLYKELGVAGLCNMFPEGKRWWRPLLEWAALGNYASMVLHNPWK